uniref:Uncharacterized protein n=1 Tax=Brassica oleracea TaxID=3712 RepID=A0A3P6ECV4_BRAOL|nr:unnamed protein product [Brassica oleracea]
MKTVGFPLALQLVAFRCVPRLASFVGGDDSVTIMDYPEKAMPLHAGLSVAHIRKAQHDPLLIVEPMLEISGDHDDRWGLWDDETYDKKVDYMVQLLKNGHVFVKENWLGGDALDPLFVYEEKPKTPKRKKNLAAEPEPIRKQRRIMLIANNISQAVKRLQQKQLRQSKKQYPKIQPNYRGKSA